MKKYHHLTQEERYQIYTLKKEGLSPEAIGKNIGRSKSTIGREINHNKGKRGYRPKQAHNLAKD